MCLLAMVVAAAAKGQRPEPSCSGEPPFECPEWWAISMLGMSMPAISIADMSWFLAWVAMAPATRVWPVQMTSPPCPGMNPAGISARVQNATSNSTASTEFCAHPIAVRFLT